MYLQETGKSLESISDVAVHLGQNTNPRTVKRKTGVLQTTEIWTVVFGCRGRPWGSISDIVELGFRACAICFWQVFDL